MSTVLKKHTFVIVSFSFAILVNAADLHSEICQPAPDGQGCSQAACPDSNQQCMPVKIRVNYNEQTPTYSILECECMDIQIDCHININPQFDVYATGICSDPDNQCQLIETDNGDGTIDYECDCASILSEFLAGDTPPGQASNPDPADTAITVSRTTDLSWTAGDGAVTRDVYFGTVNPPVTKVLSDTTDLTYNPGLIGGRTYYWRVDEKNSVGTTTGVIWRFTTICMGDYLRDGKITTADISGLVFYWNANKNIFGKAPVSVNIPEIDINCDGVITTADISALVVYWNATKNIFLFAPCALPECVY